MTYDYDRSRTAAKKEVKTPDLETVTAVGKGKGTFGVEYWIQGTSGGKAVMNERSSGGDPKSKFRYKLRNEYDVPTRRVEQLIKELDD